MSLLPLILFSLLSLAPHHAVIIPMHNEYLVTLPTVCQTILCRQRALDTLSTLNCTHIRTYPLLPTIRARCPHPPLSPRFQHSQPHLHAFARPFVRVSTLQFMSNTAFTPAGERVTLPKRSCRTPTASPVVVYIIDTGCNESHEQLRGRVVSRLAPKSSFHSSRDEHGHGTHVAALIAGRDFGVAPSASLVCYKALSDANTGTARDVVAALDHISRTHNRSLPAVVSISLGVRAARRYTRLDRAISGAARNGLIPVVAAGNAGVDACTYTPARAHMAITVAATAHDGRIATFSNWGGCVDVAATGVGVWSAIGSSNLYGVSSGTSMAAPVVSGLIALRLAEKGRLSLPDIRHWLRSISHPIEGVPVVTPDMYCKQRNTDSDQ